MDSVIFEHLVRLLFASEDYRGYQALRCTNNFWFRFDTDQLCKEAFLAQWGPLTGALSFEDFDWERELVRRRFLMRCDDVWELRNGLVVPPRVASELTDSHATRRWRAHAMMIHGSTLYKWTTYNGSALAASFSLAPSLVAQLPLPHQAGQSLALHWLFKHYLRDASNTRCGDDWGKLNDYLELMRPLEFTPGHVVSDLLQIQSLTVDDVLFTIGYLPNDPVEQFERALNTALFLMRCPYLPAANNDADSNNTTASLVVNSEEAEANRARELAAIKARLSTPDALRREMGCGRYEWASLLSVRDDLDSPNFFTDCGYRSTAALLMCVARGGGTWTNMTTSDGSDVQPVLPMHAKTYFTMLAAHDAS